MANEGHIHVKKGRPKDYRKALYDAELDNGANKPSWTYTGRIKAMKDRLGSMEKSQSEGWVPPEERARYDHNYKREKERLEKILESKEKADKWFEENKDYAAQRREELAEHIKEGMHSKTDGMGKKVNPHTVLKREKGGLEEAKREFMVLSKGLGEESNITFLQKG